ncbi:hypothetical protein FHS68_004640 [Dyadobacter arcticus]|uniref:Uncharacterized protein n=1 Tax=Dyadobacter arcticus TaxID=1078754 RepID=A0ABX0UR22_9BACT|nr:hypothetical protein [Dyadobacter arcticus]
MQECISLTTGESFALIWLLKKSVAGEIEIGGGEQKLAAR